MLPVGPHHSQTARTESLQAIRLLMRCSSWSGSSRPHHRDRDAKVVRSTGCRRGMIRPRHPALQARHAPVGLADHLEARVEALHDHAPIRILLADEEVRLMLIEEDDRFVGRDHAARPLSKIRDRAPGGDLPASARRSPEARSRRDVFQRERSCGVMGRPPKEFESIIPTR